MLQVHQSETCSVAACAEIVGAKWTVLIVHELSEGARRFTQIEHSCAGISPRTLAERLRWLEAEEIVVRRSYAESPPRVEYELTEKGAALLPLIQRCAGSATTGSAAACMITDAKPPPDGGRGCRGTRAGRTLQDAAARLARILKPGTYGSP